MDFEKYMREALGLAEEAARCGDVPVGCVITDENGEIISRGVNRRARDGDATAHAEIEAIREACAALGRWNLSDCAIFVTLEPCPMCAGAVINARIPVLVYGAKEPVSGSCGSVINLFEERYGHKPAVYSGILAEESSELLRKFFEGMRKKEQ